MKLNKEHLDQRIVALGKWQNGDIRERERPDTDRCLMMRGCGLDEVGSIRMLVVGNILKSLAGDQTINLGIG